MLAISALRFPKLEPSLLIHLEISASLLLLLDLYSTILRAPLTSELSENRTLQFYSRPTTQISFIVIIIWRLELSWILTMFMDWENDLRRVLERKMGSGPFSTETEDRTLTMDREDKLMDISHFICSKNAINFSTSTISEVRMLWMLSKKLKMASNILLIK